MYNRAPHNPTPYDDDWEDQPSQGSFYKWGLGMILPLFVFGWGLTTAWTQQAVFGARVTANLSGLNAVALGCSAMCLGIFLNCHYFWGNVYDQAWPAVLGKLLGAMGFIAGLGLLIVRWGVLGKQ